MAVNWRKQFGAAKTEAALLVLFIPSMDRDEEPIIDQPYWVKEALELLGDCFGAATAFPQGQGVWKDEDRGGLLIWDAPVIIYCYTNKRKVAKHAKTLITFLRRLGRETNQAAVGYVFMDKYYELRPPF